MNNIQKGLRKYSNSKRKKSNEWFFKTGKGEYGEGDKFIGVSMPNIRRIVNKYKNITLKEVKELLDSPIHEERMTGALILTKKYKDNNKKIYRFYLRNIKRINNWDLVDCSTPHIIGGYLVENKKEIKILNKLVKSKNMWERRIAILATMRFIDKGQVKECLKISKILLRDEQDLIHKAVGWMLREAWKKEPTKIEEFIKKNYDEIPRTTLRYTIERMKKEKRKKYLQGRFK